MTKSHTAKLPAPHAWLDLFPQQLQRYGRAWDLSTDGAVFLYQGRVRSRREAALVDLRGVSRPMDLGRRKLGEDGGDEGQSPAGVEVSPRLMGTRDGEKLSGSERRNGDQARVAVYS
jgi:hypothetical protein